MEGVEDWKPLSLFPEFSGALMAAGPFTIASPEGMQPRHGNTNGMAVASLVMGPTGLLPADVVALLEHSRAIAALFGALWLALLHPVASDLRFITMSMKFVTDLERIGDLAVGIAKRSLEINRLPSFQLNGNLARLAVLVQVNLRAALDAFVAKDADRATAVIAADIEVDRLNASLFAELIAHVVTDPANVTRVLPLTSVCRYLERIGDHVKNLAEGVVYMVRARDVRHRSVQPKSS
ncbi:MAG: phosphate signaling complex protein PhoU [Myxococcales bacterium]|nr:phosphate signaling complex protein PhoU [Myxococcales bacterium]